MKNWTHKIIIELYQNYSEVPSDLCRFANSKLNIPKYDMAQARNFVRTLNELEVAGYITWKACTIGKDENGKDLFGEWDEIEYANHSISWVKNAIGHIRNEIPQTLSNNRIEGRLTVTGLEYAIELRRELIKYILTLVTTPLSVLFAALAAFIAWLAYDKPTTDYTPKIQELSQEVQKLRKEIQKQDTVYTIPLPFPKRPSRTE